MAGFSLRSAMQTDEAFLWRMVREAVNWLPERSLTLPEIEADPDLAHYVHGWMTSTDLGVVAVGDDGPIGAAWLRYFAAADPGFGYVDDATPEVSIAVVRSHRGRGVGRALLRAVMDGASARGVPAISLSVERANPARRLYLSEGFSVVAGWVGHHARHGEGNPAPDDQGWLGLPQHRGDGRPAVRRGQAWSTPRTS